MNKFKSGDRVIYIGPNCVGFTRGKSYEVKYPYEDGCKWRVTILLDDRGSYSNGHSEDYFELMAPTCTSSSVTRETTLPTDSEARKGIPMLRGCLRYFPAALAGVANTSKLGNDKHNPGEDMHHARGKSTDQGDCILRHIIDVQDLLAAYERSNDVKVEDILVEVNQLAWRALAFSQEIHEMFGAPLAPGARLPKVKP